MSEKETFHNIKNKLLNYLLCSYDKEVIKNNSIDLKKEVSLTSFKLNKHDNFIDENRDFLDVVLKELVDKYYITLKFNQSNLSLSFFDKIILNTSKIDEILLEHPYGFEYKKRFAFKEELEKFLQKSHYNSSFVKKYLDAISLKVENKKSLTTLLVNKELNVNNIKLTADLFEFLYNLKNKNTSLPVRIISQKVFSESKYLENNISFFIRLFINLNDDGIKETSEEEFYEYFNVYKNSKYILIKNGLTLKIDKLKINLDRLNSPISLSKDQINLLKIVKISKIKLLTIENLTTFNYLSSLKEFNDYVLIFLSGFHSNQINVLLRKIKELNKIKEYYHFGDLDPFGLEIFVNLKAKTDIDFRPYLMNETIFNKYINYSKELNEKDIKLLLNIKNNENYQEFSKLIEVMIKTNKKLEQEIIIEEW